MGGHAVTFGNYVPPPRVNGDLVWTGTGGESDVHSYAYIILNEIYNRLAGTSMFSGFPCKRLTQALPIEAGLQVPFIGVYSPEELYGPDGDHNAGEIRLTHTVPVGIQIVLKNNDPVKLLEKLDIAYWFVMNQILRDDSLTNLWQTMMPDSTQFEGVIRGGVRENWFLAQGSRSTTAETPIAEKLIELALVFRTMWYPTEFDDLHRITVRTAFPEGSTPEEQLQVQQVTMVYEFDTTTGDAVPYPLPDDTEPPPNPFP
jgi:hypothetical protein